MNAIPTLHLADPFPPNPLHRARISELLTKLGPSRYTGPPRRSALAILGAIEGLPRDARRSATARSAESARWTSRSGDLATPTDNRYIAHMPAGRPSKYDPAYCEMIVAHMAEGASATSFAAEIDVARSTLNEWADNHPEFSEALSRGKAKCAAWWEKVGRTSARDGTGNATMIVFGLKNMSRDDWQDKQLIGSDPENPMPAGFTVNLVKSDPKAG